MSQPSGMAPRRSAKELDAIQKLSCKGKTPQQVQAHIGKARARLADAPAAPHISQIHRALAGKSHDRQEDAVSTGGRGRRRVSPVASTLSTPPLMAPA